MQSTGVHIELVSPILSMGGQGAHMYFFLTTFVISSTKIRKLLEFLFPSVNSETFAKFWGKICQIFWYHKIEKKKKNPDAHHSFTHKQQKEDNFMGFL